MEKVVLESAEPSELYKRNRLGLCLPSTCKDQGGVRSFVAGNVSKSFMRRVTFI